MKALKWISLGLSILALTPAPSQATMIQLTSTSQITGATVTYNTPGSVFLQTAPYGVDVFVAGPFTNTSGIHFLFTGNANAPIGPPSALSLGGTPGPSTYFHFSPQSGYNLNAIGLSATGGYTDQSTTFHVIAVDAASNLLQYDVTMNPTAAGIAGLNGGAVFLGVSSTLPLVAFRVSQLDDGFGVLDNLRLDVTAVPEPSALMLAACAALGLTLVAGRRRRRA